MAAPLPGRAAAATPCWKQVLNDWSKGRAIGVYPLHCYRDAIKNLPEDVRDVDAVAQEFGVSVDEEGLAGRECALEDPDGNRLRVATRRSN